MPTWNGWQSQFLHAAGILETPPNLRFLNNWASHATSNCKNNPIDLTHRTTGSTNCAKATGVFPQYQTYSSHARAASAFAWEVKYDPFQALFNALDSGNPFQVANPSDVGSVLVSWGSVKFFNWYMAQIQSGGGGGGGTGGGDGPGAHKGWVNLRRSVNHKMPKSLHASERNIQAALRSLGHAHKVKN